MNLIEQKKSELDNILKQKELLSKEEETITKEIEKLERITPEYSLSGDIFRIKFYDTNIVSFDDNRIILDTGGFKTPSTRRHMNEVSKTFDLGFNITSEKHVWEIHYKGEIIQFDKDKIILDR